ncbi:MAG: GGDEF domain-containing protein [Sulfuriferula sp.]
MKTPTENSTPQNPAEIAREAFRQLAMQKIAPTPEAYRAAYNQISGVVETHNPQIILNEFATELTRLPGEASFLGKRLRKAAESNNWAAYQEDLSELVNNQLKPSMQTIVAPTASTVAQIISADSEQTQLLRELLTRTLTFAVASLLSNIPELAAESEALGNAIKEARTDAELTGIGTRLKQLCFRIELKSGDIAEQQDMLLRLFRLLLDNVSYLLDDDSWLRGQIDVVQNLIAGPVNHHALEDATQSLKEVIYKQGTLKDSLSEAKITVKNMITIFIDRLGSIATTTGDYHGKIDVYTQKIAQAQHISELNTILDDVMRDTRFIQAEALKSRDEMLVAHKEAQEAEARIHQLESQLAELSALASHDQLTNSLNRRGLDDVFAREQARADRHGTALSIAMLDIDDFKKLNDTHGHDAGDEALIHVVRIVKDTLRSMDVVGRFGGEEFIIVLPDTPTTEAVDVVGRLQKELTKRIFMFNNQKLFLTFSAGVATRTPNEAMTETIRRADEAMYKAKKAGKNRVIAAD